MNKETISLELTKIELLAVLAIMGERTGVADEELYKHLPKIHEHGTKEEFKLGSESVYDKVYELWGGDID